jgi:hypothetical protein
MILTDGPRVFVETIALDGESWGILGNGFPLFGCQRTSFDMSEALRAADRFGATCFGEMWRAKRDRGKKDFWWGNFIFGALRVLTGLGGGSTLHTLQAGSLNGVIDRVACGIGAIVAGCWWEGWRRG